MTIRYTNSLFIIITQQCWLKMLEQIELKLAIMVYSIRKSHLFSHSCPQSPAVPVQWLWHFRHYNRPLYLFTYLPTLFFGYSLDVFSLRFLPLKWWSNENICHRMRSLSQCPRVSCLISTRNEYCILGWQKRWVDDSGVVVIAADYWFFLDLAVTIAIQNWPVLCRAEH